MLCIELKLPRILVTVLVHYFSAAMEHTIFKLAAIDVSIFEIHDATFHSTFFKESCKFVSIGKLNASTFSYTSFVENSSEYVPVIVGERTLRAFALYKFSDVVRGHRLLCRVFLLLVLLTVVLEYLSVDKSSVAVHDPIAPLSIVEVTRFEFHDASSVERSSFRRKLPHIFPLGAVDLAVAELVVFKQASEVLTRLLDLEHSVSILLALQVVAAVRVPIGILVETVAMEQIVGKVTRILVPARHAENTLRHHVVLELASVHVAVAECEFAFALNLALKPIAIVFIAGNLVGQLAFSVVLAQFEIAFVARALLLIRLDTESVLDVVIDSERLGLRGRWSTVSTL